MTASSASTSNGGSFSVALTMLVVVRFALRDQLSGGAAEQQAPEGAVSQRAKMFLPDVADVVGTLGGAEGPIGFAEGQVVVDGDGHDCASLRLVSVRDRHSNAGDAVTAPCRIVCRSLLRATSDGCRRSCCSIRDARKSRTDGLLLVRLLGGFVDAVFVR